VIAEFTRVVTENKMFVIFFREKDELSPKNWKRITRGEREFVGAIRDIRADFWDSRDGGLGVPVVPP